MSQRYVPDRGDIVWLEFNPQAGHEQAGRRLLEITINGEGHKRYSGRHILEEMSHLNSTWLWYAGKRMPEQVLDTPTETQADDLKALDWEIRPGGVLQPINS